MQFSRFGMRIAITVMACAPAWAIAQQPVWSLASLADSAVRYLPRIRQKEAELASASANVTDQKHRFLPSLRFDDQVNLGTDNSLAGSYYPFGIIPSTSGGIRDANDDQAAGGNVAVLYGEYDLIDFGYRNATVQRARSLEDLRHADLDRETYVLAGQVARAYFSLLRDRARLSVDRQSSQRYDSILTVIRALTASGIRPGSDSSLAKAELAKSHISYNQVNESVKNDRQRLSYLTGIPPDSILTDSALLTIHAIRAAAMPQAGTVANPLIRYYEKLRDTYVAGEKLISKSFTPRIELTAASWARGSGITYDNQYKSLPYGWGYQRFNYMAGLSFRYDLFNGLHRRDRLRAYGYDRLAAEQELAQERLALDNATREADNALAAAEDNLRELPVQYQAALDTYRQKLAQYRAGIIALIDLTNAAFVLDRSQKDYVETLASWYQARLDRATGLGNLASFLQSFK